MAQVITIRSGDENGTLLATFERRGVVKTTKLIETFTSIQHDGCIDEVVIACENYTNHGKCYDRWLEIPDFDGSLRDELEMRLKNGL